MPMVGRTSRVTMVPSPQLGTAQECGTIADDATAQRHRLARHCPWLEGGGRRALPGAALHRRTPASGRRSAAPRDRRRLAALGAQRRALACQYGALAGRRRTALGLGGWARPALAPAVVERSWRARPRPRAARSMDLLVAPRQSCDSIALALPRHASPRPRARHHLGAPLPFRRGAAVGGGACRRHRSARPPDRL